MDGENGFKTASFSLPGEDFALNPPISSMFDRQGLATSHATTQVRT